MKFLEKIFGPTFKLSVSVLMKSGVIVEIFCDDIHIKTSGGDLVSYEFVGMKTGSAMYLRIEDISAITYTKI